MEGYRAGFWALFAAMIIAAPQMKPGVSGRTAQLLDLYPTLVELCGLTRPPGIEGHSLAPLLRNPRAKWNHPAFTVTRYQEKLGKSALSAYFPDYQGGSDVNRAAKYLLWRFNQVNRAHLNLYPHLTQATDTSNIRLVFAAVKVSSL